MSDYAQPTNALPASGTSADEDDNLAMDPGMAEMMGFSSFGVDKSKKRKLHADEAITAASLESNSKSNHHSGGSNRGVTKANATPLGIRQKDGRKAAQAPRDDQKTTVSAMNATPLDAHASALALAAGQVGQEADLDAYRFGVRQPNGDVAYFLPSFLEEPWARLQEVQSRNGAGAGPRGV